MPRASNLQRRKNSPDVAKFKQLAHSLESEGQRASNHTRIEFDAKRKITRIFNTKHTAFWTHL